MSQFKKDTFIIFECGDYKNRFGKSRICGYIKSVKGDTADIILYGMMGPGDETPLKDIPLENLCLASPEEPICRCYEIEDKINAMYPNADWGISGACKEWHNPDSLIQYTLQPANPPITFEENGDERWGVYLPCLQAHNL